MRDIRVDICFWNCEATRVEDVVAWAHVLQRHGVILLAHYTLEPLPEERWYETFQKERYRFKSFKSSIGHVFAFRDWGQMNGGFGFDEYLEEDGGGNKLEFGALLDFEFKDERPLVEPLAQRLLAIARDLYPLARPTYGEVEGNWDEWSPKDVARLRLKHISWVNFFSPAYVEKYGRDFLLGLPGYKTELLPDGGVFHQLSPTFVAPTEEEARRLRREVIAYCARHGLKVTCRAPHVIPGLTLRPEPKEAMSDAQVQEYLRQVLGVTLVLKDGTRVKPVYIPWGDLTSEQRWMVVEAIRQAAIAEIKRPGRGRIRFEFNEIPDELEQMLVELVGRDNPDFEWVQVEMGV